MATEDWVRLYTALRRVRGEDGVGAQIALDQIKSWRAKATHSCSLKRKLLMVERSEFEKTRSSQRASVAGS